LLLRGATAAFCKKASLAQFCWAGAKRARA